MLISDLCYQSQPTVTDLLFIDNAALFRGHLILFESLDTNVFRRERLFHFVELRV